MPNLGLQTTFIAADNDRGIVHRTWGLLQQIPTKKDEFYGPNFSFTEQLKARNWLFGILAHWGIGLASLLVAMLPPLRRLVRLFLYAQGEGPAVEAAKKDEIEYRAVAKPDEASAHSKVAFCRTWFNGSMYACKLPPHPPSASLKRRVY